MTTNARKLLLRANAIYLLVAASGGMWADLAGVYLGLGPQGRILAAAPHAGIGFVEAHGLAIILGVLLWQAPPERSWHLTAAAIHLLLGTSNLVFWQVFVAADMLAAGYITTSLHFAFLLLQLSAVTAAKPSPDEAPIKSPSLLGA